MLLYVIAKIKGQNRRSIAQEKDILFALDILQMEQADI